MTKEQSEEVRRKRLERFGPVESNPTQNVDADQKEAKQGANPALTKLKSAKSTAGSSQIRCKHWPKCNFSNDQCEYHHPTE